VLSWACHTVLEPDLGNDFLQLSVLASQILDFVAGGFPDRVASKLLLARFEGNADLADELQSVAQYP
jgi:hypothetical protein